MKLKSVTNFIVAMPEFLSDLSALTERYRGCPSIRANYDQGNIYQDDFMEVWNNRFEKFRNREWARQGECADCNLFRYCEGNGMHLHDESGKLMTCHYHRL